YALWLSEQVTISTPRKGERKDTDQSRRKQPKTAPAQVRDGAATVDQRTPVAKRICGGGEPDPERADQGSAAAFGGRKSNTGRDCSPPGSNGAGGRGGNGQARNDSGLVSEAHGEQI